MQLAVKWRSRAAAQKLEYLDAPKPNREGTQVRAESPPAVQASCCIVSDGRPGSGAARAQKAVKTNVLGVLITAPHSILGPH